MSNVSPRQMGAVESRGRSTQTQNGVGTRWCSLVISPFLLVTLKSLIFMKGQVLGNDQLINQGPIVRPRKRKRREPWDQ